MAITAHWIDSDFVLQNMLLTFQPLDGPHSGEWIMEVFFKTITKYKIQQKISCVTVDNATSNINFLERLAIKPEINNSFFKPFKNNHVRCLAHVFHLGAQAIINSFEDIQQEEDSTLESFLENPENCSDLVSERFIKDIENLSLEENPKGTRVVELKPISRLRKFLFSIKLNATKKVTLAGLQRKYLLDETLPVLDVRTRWNSTFNMINWAIINKKALVAMMLSINFEYTHSKALERLQFFLKPFNQVTSKVASQNSVSLGLALISMESLIVKLAKGISDPTTTPTIKTALTAAYSKMLNYQPKYQEKLFLIATLLHPRAKASYIMRKTPHCMKRQSMHFTRFMRHTNLLFQNVNLKNQKSCMTIYLMSY